SRLSRLRECGLTAGCCEDLSSVLSTNSSLTELHLNCNKLGDSGVKRLSAGLRDPNCKLQTLGVQRCGLTAGCCEDLSFVLSTNSSLTELNLSRNKKLFDSGVKHLSAGLRDPNCKLQALGLGFSKYKTKIKTRTESLLQYQRWESCSGEYAVERLSAGLRDPNCKLQTLGLGGCDLTAGCCEDLCSVLCTNSSLMELHLNSNDLGDSGVKRLSAGLRDPNCKLQKLVLWGCDLTAGCCEDLSSVLSTNSSLTELDLSSNYNLRDSGVKRLSAGLRDPNCKLQTLFRMLGFSK
uniref:Uncharacterized protein n=1 Tax=Latimeria chalumnae TaxID=7897 RepID=H2ZT63_LATCH